ncbi:MAG: hypothetical protein G3M70_02050 [Candidatus Nitronauta litoralis]|uniref:HTH luxR-type domain-containing protein n=1 Tax=Candidatus Nitronauta litoralis TaxID=2705533 RepID=A0A7T0BTJ0_9BACT|nr:MAG: hypothetical protein G3M70_02050 [Candidatus Nitronauta litoralis]
MDDPKKAYKVLLIFSSAFSILVGVDLITDFSSGGSGSHLIVEGLLLTISAGFFIYGARQLQQANTRIRSLQQDMDRLTAEQEVGFFLIKGFSLKEISDLRNTKIKTTQQQAQCIYQKSGLANRSELSALFLEDLLPPQPLPSST